MNTPFHLNPNPAELDDYLKAMPPGGTRMVFNPLNGALVIRYTPLNDTEAVHFKMKWSDQIHADGSPRNIMANIIVNQSIRNGH